ncbi:integrase [Gossypium australe]|uniref:Integrase n=1 Tax=Gossypium australe TaxID=47621 RepID=A0A5B6WYJ8_9ROSI|nr:integrase [Gossypium australe]
MIFSETHNSPYAMNLGSNKMYYDLCKLYWWLKLKLAITEFVAKCFTCQKVEAEHQYSSGLLQPLKVREWKWERITMYFVLGLSLSTTKKDDIQKTCNDTVFWCSLKVGNVVNSGKVHL